MVFSGVQSLMVNDFTIGARRKLSKSSRKVNTTSVAKNMTNSAGLESFSNLISQEAKEQGAQRVSKKNLLGLIGSLQAKGRMPTNVKGLNRMDGSKLIVNIVPDIDITKDGWEVMKKFANKTGFKNAHNVEKQINKNKTAIMTQLRELGYQIPKHLTVSKVNVGSILNILAKAAK